MKVDDWKEFGNGLRDLEFRVYPMMTVLSFPGLSNPTYDVIVRGPQGRRKAVDMFRISIPKNRIRPWICAIGRGQYYPELVQTFALVQEVMELWGRFAPAARYAKEFPRPYLKGVLNA